MAPPLLEIDNVTIQYETPEGSLTAVSDASFVVEDGEYLGLVGESGCGKTTLAHSIIGGLDDNGRLVSGEIRYKGEPIHRYSEGELNETIRWKEISYIPQGSMNSLDPLERISDQAVEIGRTHTDRSKSAIREKLRELFEIVGISAERISEYPHEFSGGMQQRAIIALSLLTDPSLIIADEPTTALDVIMQDQVFKYLDKVRDETDTSILLITHDISLIFEVCERLAIMHGGQIMESGSTLELFKEPRHPYAILLQEAFPDIRYPLRELEIIDGYPPQTFGDVDYCTFVERCPWAVEECEASAPPLEPYGDTSDGHRSHQVRCFRKDEVSELYDTDRPRGSTEESASGLGSER